LLGVGLGFLALALILSALPVAGSDSAAPPAQPSERPTVDFAETHAAQTEAARPPATETSAPPPATETSAPPPATETSAPPPATDTSAPPPTSPPGDGDGGGGPQPTEAAPTSILLPSATGTPTATRPRVTRTPSPTPTQTPDVDATNQVFVQAAIQGTLTSLPPEATAFITITVLAPTAVPPTLAPTVVPPTAAPVSAPTQPATVAEANQLGAALWLVVVVPLVLLIVVLFWLVGYRFLLPFVGLGRPRPRPGDVKAGRQYARRKRLPY